MELNLNENLKPLFSTNKNPYYFLFFTNDSLDKQKLIVKLADSFVNITWHKGSFSLFLHSVMLIISSLVSSYIVLCSRVNRIINVSLKKNIVSGWVYSNVLGQHRQNTNGLKLFSKLLCSVIVSLLLVSCYLIIAFEQYEILYFKCSIEIMHKKIALSSVTYL